MNVNIPHQYWYVVEDSLFGQPVQEMPWLTPVVVHAVQSRPGKVLCFHAMTSFGANYSGIPMHHLRWHPKVPSSVGESIENCDWRFFQTWGCFDSSPQVITYDFLSGMKAKIVGAGMSVTYAFTVYWPDSPFTAQANQYKEGHVVLAEDGTIRMLPNNLLHWQDKAWVTDPMPKRPLSALTPEHWVDPESRQKGRVDGDALDYGVSGEQARGASKRKGRS